MTNKKTALFLFEDTFYMVELGDGTAGVEGFKGGEGYLGLPDGRQLAVKFPEHEDPNYVFAVFDEGEVSVDHPDDAVYAAVFPGTLAVRLTAEELATLTALPADPEPEGTEERPLAVSSDGDVLDPTTHGVDAAYEPHHDTTVAAASPTPTLAEEGAPSELSEGEAPPFADDGDFVPPTPPKRVSEGSGSWPM